MEFSDASQLRAQYLEYMEVPSMSTITEQLGESLAQVMFTNCPEVLKPMLGLEPPLKGAGNELWTSPSDLLAGKVCLKPPLTSKQLRALTHQGILESLKLENLGNLDRSSEWLTKKLTIFGKNFEI